MDRIFSYAGENKKFFLGAIFLLFISTVCGIIPFFLLSQIIVSLLTNTFEIGSAISAIVYICVLLLLKQVTFGGGLGLSHIGAFRTLFNMRNTFAKSMARQPMGHIMDQGTGKYKKTFVEDISTLESALAHMVPEGIPYIFGVFLTLITIFFVDWRIGLSVLVTIPVSMIPMAYMMKVGLSKMPSYYESRGRLSHTIIEYVSGMEVIKIFNRTDKSYSKLAETVKDSRDFTLEWCKVTWKSQSVLYSLLPCTLLVALPVCAYSYFNQTMSLDTMLLGCMLALSMGTPLIKLVSFMPSIPMLNYTIEKIENIVLHDDVKHGDFCEHIDKPDVEFNDVHFSYNEKEVIKGVSMKVPSGSICAIVGPSGSGKSTLAKLLMHFWDISAGEIKIGGHDLCDFTFDSAMDHLSYVSQENTLFDGSILSNLQIANEDATKEEIIEACKKARCHDFISSLSQGYDSQVGTLGGKLSGGERQRICIARAIIKNAPIIVLDEATAFADAENEFLIQEGLSELLAGKTVIMIAHKLHTITSVDQIVVLNDGRVEMCGKHDDLLNECDTYKTLWEQNQKSISWDLGGAQNA